MTLVLVHGGMHGAWCWNAVLPLLQGPVTAIDMPGRGQHPAEHAGLAAEDFADALMSKVDRLARIGGPVVLVGHSFGGIAITLAASRRPEQVRHLVYVGAMLPPPGESPADTTNVAAWFHGLRAEGAVSYYAEPVALARRLCPECPPERAAEIERLVVPEPLRPMVETMPDWKLPPTLPVTWIKTLRDVAQTPEQQDESIALLRRGGSDVDVVELDASHNVMMIDPQGVADVLDHLG